jgi:uncharacterized delta-60 repeat protein
MAIHPRAALTLLCLCAAAVHARPGDLDPTFSSDGRLTSTAGSAALAVVQQADDKLVFVADGGAGDFVVARLAADGTPDAGFGAGGVATIDLGGVDELATALIRQSDGMLVAAGSSDGDIALARLDANGAPDPSFSGDGKLVLDLGDADDAVAGLLQQPDDKLVVVATSGGQIVFARFDADGSPDNGFGTAGVTRVDFGAPLQATGLARQPDGKLVAIGVDTGAGQGARFNVVRVTDTGTLDASFDTDGLASVAFTGTEAAANGVAVQADGKVVVTGYFVATGASPLAPTGRIIRLTDAGALDTTFSGDGIAAIDAGSRAIPTAVIVQPDTTIVVAGVRGAQITADGALPPPADLFITRLNAGGGTDLAFGLAGIAAADFGSADQAPASAGRALVRQSDGMIVVAGESAGEAALARFGDADYAGLAGITATVGSATEGGNITITVRRTGGATGIASVDYATAAGTAQAGSDFTATSGTLTWATNDANFQTVTIGTLDDAAFEGAETLTLTLSNPVGVELAASEATLTIVDNDVAAPGTLAVAAASQSVGEADGPVSIRVTRTGGSDGAVSVQYATASGTATAGSDFATATGTLDWAAGDSTDKFIDVDVTSDTTDESNETFTVTLSAPTGGATLGTALTTVTITDDDTAGGGGGGGGGGGALGLVGIALVALALVRRSRRRRAVAD